jgi:hypothetical protein
MSSAVTISVLLPVWNCPHYVGQAIESILKQSCSSFEFIIIDDGSTDNTPEVLRKYQDPRIRFVQHANRGLAATLNEGIELARGKYIARQDQDDVSLPERLAKQFAYMESHPECGLLGSWAQIMEGDRLTERYHRHPACLSELRYHLLFNNPFVHSSVMLRKRAVDAVGGYSTDPERQPPEDYELWSRMSRQVGVANLPEVLLYYREVLGSMSRVGSSPFRAKLVKICRENLALASGFAVTDPDLVAIASILHGADGSFRPQKKRVMDILHAAATSIVGNSELDAEVAQTVSAVMAGAAVRRLPFGSLVDRPGPLRHIAKKFWRFLKARS